MKIVIASIVVAAAVSLVAPCAGWAADLAVGTTAPALELRDSDGEPRVLSAGSGAKILIFYRGLW